MITKESLAFLADLKENNDRDWFIENKNRYEIYKQNYYNFAQKLLDKMIVLDDSLKNLEVKNVVFRINRDIRFSKNKTPYKTHLAIWFSAGAKKDNLAGYYLHIENGKSFVAGGLYWPEAEALAKIRKEIAFFQNDLENIVDDAQFKTLYKELERTENNSLKTSPKNYDKEHPAIEVLRLKSFVASAPLSDKEILKNDFADKVAQKMIVLKPLVDFLNRGLQS